MYANIWKIELPIINYVSISSYYAASLYNIGEYHYMGIATHLYFITEIIYFAPIVGYLLFLLYTRFKNNARN